METLPPLPVENPSCLAPGAAEEKDDDAVVADIAVENTFSSPSAEGEEKPSTAPPLGAPNSSSPKTSVSVSEGVGGGRMLLLLLSLLLPLASIVLPT